MINLLTPAAAALPTVSFSMLGLPPGGGMFSEPLEMGSDCWEGALLEAAGMAGSPFMVWRVLALFLVLMPPPPAPPPLTAPPPPPPPRLFELAVTAEGRGTY